MRQSLAVLPTFGLLWLVFWISAGVLGFEIALMRMLLAASWHHFAFLVISIALLGFGASGTVLTFARRVVLRRPRSAILLLTLAAAAAMPLCAGLAQHVPIEAKVVPSLIWRQLGSWVLFWALLTVPFLLGAAAIGAALMVAETRVATVYGANLLGSAAGALLAPLCMYLLPPACLPLAMAVPAWFGAAGFRSGARWVTAIGWVGSMAIAGALLGLDPPHLRLDPYKYGAYLRRLEAQEAAQRTAWRCSPRAMTEAWRSDALHDFPFLAMDQAPPAMSALTSDGHWRGSVLDIDSMHEAEVVDHALMAFPYALAPDEPQVLLLGEAGGTNVWLALRRGASRIDVVQPNAAIFSLMMDDLRHQGGGVLLERPVHPILAEPRHHIEHETRQYDVLQLVSLESSAAGSGGVGGLGEDYLVTVEGLRAGLDRLRERGVLFVCRGIQTPPRDTVKLLATLIEALRRLGVDEADDHIIMVRDYLAVCTIVRRAPWTDEEIQRVRGLCAQRQLTPVWFRGVGPEELNRPDALPQPPDGMGDWYHYAARQLFSDHAERFIGEWRFDIRPPTDNRPFFLDFCKLGSIGALKRAFGPLWLTHAELAYLFVIAAAVAIATIGALLTIAPLLLMRGWRRSRGKTATAVYFTAIGLAYLLLEMTFLSRLRLWIGDPVLTAAVVIAGFLVLSGAGSLTAQRIRRREARLLMGAIALLVVCGLAVFTLLLPAAGVIGAWPVWARCAGALVAVAPLGYLMGFPMPMGLARLDLAAPALLPWAWGVNGFASVLAAPLATAVGMTWGFHIAALSALALYAAAGIAFATLPAGSSGN